MKKHPRIRELQLGKTCEELANELLEGGDYDFQKSEHCDKLASFIRKLAEDNDPNVRFGVYFGSETSYITAVNSTTDFEIHCNYFDSEWNYHDEDDAHSDCALYNDLVTEILGPPEKLPKGLTNAESLKKKGKVCPWCRSNKHRILDDFRTDELMQEFGCKSCGRTWRIFYERTLKRVIKMD